LRDRGDFGPALVKMPGVNTAQLKATIVIPADGPWFEGHFPGKPLLPGVTELALAIAALRQETGKPLLLRRVGFARLRHLVRPGDRLELSARESSGPEDQTARLRFELARGSLLVANGEFIIGTRLSPPEELPDRRIKPGASGPAGDLPSLEALLPHRPPMRFVDSILRQSADALDCIARIPAACALVSGGTAPTVAAIEAAAQAAAAWEALQRWQRQGETAPRLGYLVSMRDIAFFTDAIPADRSLLVSVQLETVSPPLSHYRFEVCLDSLLLARGSIGTYLAA
jgi:3-hydroxyacyl-[acyl-carrier-protein] dehydratase